MKRILLIPMVVIVGLLGLLWSLKDLSPAQLSSATGLGNGLGAKLFCSGRHISGFSDERLVDDIATYSALTRYIDYTELPEGGISASLAGSGPAIARFRPGLGCTLEFAEGSVLDGVMPPARPTPSTEPWPRGSGDTPGDKAMQDLLDAVLAQDNAAGLDTRALLVVQDGKVLAEAYAEGIDRQTPLLGWSMGKSVTAMMLGQLEARGELDLNEQGLFPQWQGDERSTINLKNLLQMSSGLAFSEDYVPGNDSTLMLFMSPSAADVAMQSPLEHPPGSFFYYSSGTTNLLSLLLYQRVGGDTQSLLDFYEREVQAPMGLENTWMELDASGVFVGSSYVYATARDWGRFGHVMVNDGLINGQRIVTPDWIARATEPNNSDNYRRYGYQFWLNRGDAALEWPSLPASAYAMQGNRKQVVMMLPQQRAVIVRLGWSPGDYPVDERFARITGSLTGP
ncbi:MAG: serine hydrolase domain-containing protein [Halioglobus sp.]